MTNHNQWMADPFVTLDPNNIEKAHVGATKVLHKSVKVFTRMGVDGAACLQVAKTIQGQVLCGVC